MAHLAVALGAALLVAVPAAVPAQSPQRPPRAEKPMGTPPEQIQEVRSLDSVLRELDALRREVQRLRQQERQPGAAPESKEQPQGPGPVPRGTPPQNHSAAPGHATGPRPQGLPFVRSQSSAHADDWFHETEANLADGLTLGAYIDGLYQAVDDSDDPAANRAFLREFEIGVGMRLTDDLEGVAVVAFNEVFEDEGGGPERGLEIDLEEAYLRHRWFEKRLSLRAGKLRNDFGRNNRRHTHDLLEVSRPEVIRAYFSEEGVFTTGAELTYTFDDGLRDSWYGDLSATVFDPDAGGEVPLFGGTGSEGPGIGSRGMLGKEVLGGPLELGASQLFFATGTDSGDEANLFGIDIAWEPGPIAVEGEWLWFRGDTPGVASPLRSADGGYLAVHYQPHPTWSIGVRGDRVDFLGTAGNAPGDTLRGVSGVASWYPAADFRIRAELQHVDVDSAFGDTEELRFFLGFTIGLGAAHVHGVGMHHSHAH